ncbi:MAG: hypothetical protein ABI181_11060 [Mycobacteriaceae bacterium]
MTAVVPGSAAATFGQLVRDAVARTINTDLTRVRVKYPAVGRSAPTKSTLLARALQDGLLDLDSL